MRTLRTASVLLTTIVAALFVAPSTASAGGALPPDVARPLGHSMTQWQQTLNQWVLGSSDNPVFTDTCGRNDGKVFYVSPPTNPSGERHCEVPLGKFIVTAPAMAFSEIPTFGSNDAEVIADAALTWGLRDFSHAVLDGKELELGDGVAAGAWTLTVEEGSFYDLINDGTLDDWAPGDEVRLATQGQTIVIPPLRPGVHELELEASFAGGIGYFHETMVLHAG
jgi:hypothetical protein